MSGLWDAIDELRHQWRSLEEQWETACDLWQDPVRFSFEREFWEEWEKAVRAALDTMGELAEVIEAARRAVLLTQGPGSWRFREGPGPAGWPFT